MSNDLLEKLPPTGFLRIAQVLELIPISKSTWWDGVKEKRFPQPIKISPKITVWRVEDIRALIISLGMGRK
ncbi:AlpA family phage regulatory protein [Desulfovibrio sp. OttesenSCG-928-I05]|nr:AlpA family phage regulatory protein [Desulfovibrio sp. OttesenSCG-928-O18]MDL2271431.1 AlpA family phage regulatory protein [Desulfovibrio sp. OttesenSCG-928-I05]